MEVQDYLEKYRTLHNILLEFLDEESNDIQSLIFEYQNQSDTGELINFLTLLHNVTIFHHSTPTLYAKIKQILVKLKAEIQNQLTNFEIFDIFKENKRILLILFEEKIITADKEIATVLTQPSYTNQFYYFFFFPELSNFLNEMMKKRAEKKKNTYQPGEFELNRQKGENEHYICELIRNDSIDDFIIFMNGNNISISNQIKPSIFETNPFLLDIDNKNEMPTYIEYAAFCGSIRIFNYLRLKKAAMKSSLWIYAIHGRNPEIIQILEEKRVKLPFNSYNKCIKEAIKCHHNDIADYFITNFIGRYEKNIFYSFAIQFNNFNYFPEIVDDKSVIIDSFNYGFTLLGILLILEGKKDLLSIDEIIELMRILLDKNDIESFKSLIIIEEIKVISKLNKINNLQKIVIPSIVESIEKGAFENCSSLVEVSFEENSKLTLIKDDAFERCTSLEKITFPHSINSIGRGCFRDCSSLQQITIPSLVSKISIGCFNGCSKLNQVSIPSSVTEIEPYSFRDCSSLINIIIPDSVKSIGHHCFEKCSSLVEIEIPSSVSKINDFTFSDCTSLKKVTIPSSVISIGFQSFKNCTGLNQIILQPSSVKSIGSSAFEGCTSLFQINIPSSVSSIGNSAFKGCKSLEHIEIQSSAIRFGEGVFDECPSSLFSSIH